MANFKFLHAADIHLDSPLRGLSRYEGVPVEQVRHATRAALNNLVDAAIEENVAFVVIAGDLYDGDWDHFGTGLFFCGAMSRLNAAGIEVYIAFGNHDADSLQTKRLPLPTNVHVFAHKAPQTYVHEGSGAVLHGQSYKDRDPGGDLAINYPSAHIGRFNVGVLHTALEGGRPPHAPYAPCTPTQLASKGYEYWALGHVHTHEVVSTDPYIVFPGNLQGRNIRECGPKGAVLVTVENDTIAQIELVTCDSVRWAHVEVDLSACSENSHMETKLRESLALAHLNSGGRPLVARLTLVGRTPLHGMLVQRHGVLREEARAFAAIVSDQLWLEKVQLATQSSEKPTDLGLDADEIGALFDEGAANSELHDALSADFSAFLSRIPPDLGEDSEILRAIRSGSYADILNDAAAAVRARLGEGSL